MATVKVSNNQNTYEVDESDLPKAMKDGYMPVISVAKGSDKFDVHPEDLPKALADGYRPIQHSDPLPDISKTESAARGLAQGASLGYADEITGGLEAAKDKLLGNSDKDLADLYKQHRDESRNAYDQAQAANPITYGAGQVGGAVATSLIPGLGEMNVGKLAALGAVQGLGDSKAEDVSGMAKDTAMGGAIGGVTGVAMKAAAPIIGKVAGATKNAVADSADYMAGKAGRVFAGVPEDVTERYLANPAAVNGAMSRDELAEHIMGENGPIEQLKKHVGELSGKAWNTLSQEPQFPKEDVINAGKDLISEITGGKNNAIMRNGGIGASADKIKAIEGQLKLIQAHYGDQLSEVDLKSIVKDLQDLAFGFEGNPKYTSQAEALRKLSGAYNAELKGSNQAYADAMVPVAEATDQLQSLQKAFVNKQDPDAVDKALTALKGWQKKSDSSSMKKAVRFTDETLQPELQQASAPALENEAEQATNTSLENKIQSTQDQEAFGKTDTAGSRKTVLGTVVGGAAGFMMGGPFGGTAGAAIGGLAGQAADKYAGQAFQKLLDGKMATGEAMSYLGQHLGPYAKVLGNAAQRGPQALTAAHFILQQSDPEYRKRINAINGTGN